MKNKAQRETQLCAALVKYLHKRFPRWVIFNHCDRARSGVPDISINDGPTVWLELKLADPDFDSQGVQELTMRRLNRRGRAFYLIFTVDLDTHEVSRTTITGPRCFVSWQEQPYTDGFDVVAIGDFLEVQIGD